MKCSRYGQNVTFRFAAAIRSQQFNVWSMHFQSHRILDCLPYMCLWFDTVVGTSFSFYVYFLFACTFLRTLVLRIPNHLCVWHDSFFRCCCVVCVRLSILFIDLKSINKSKSFFPLICCDVYKLILFFPVWLKLCRSNIKTYSSCARTHTHTAARLAQAHKHAPLTIGNRIRHDYGIRLVDAWKKKGFIYVMRLQFYRINATWWTLYVQDIHKIKLLQIRYVCSFFVIMFFWGRCVFSTLEFTYRVSCNLFCPKCAVCTLHYSDCKYLAGVFNCIYRKFRFRFSSFQHYLCTQQTPYSPAPWSVSQISMK